MPIIPGIVASGGGSLPTDADFASVVYLSHFDGVDEATTAIDSSDTGAVITLKAGVNAWLDTAQKVFGSASANFVNATGRATTPNSNDYDLDTNDWTVETRFRRSATGSGQQHIVGLWYEGGNRRSYAIVYDVAGGNLELLLSTAGTVTITKISVAFTFTNDTWFAFAADWDGTTYRLYVDGAVVGTATGAVVPYGPVSSVGISLGADPVGVGSILGWADECRVTNGVARYAGAYTIADAPFPDTGP